MRTKLGQHVKLYEHAFIYRNTFQGKNLVSQSIHNGQQRHLIRHVEEVVS